MKKSKIIGGLLLILAVTTIVGMIVDNVTFWIIYNWATIILSTVGGIILLKENYGK